MTIPSRPLPKFFAERHDGWMATGFENIRAVYQRPANGGQRPRAVVTSCYDSRVHAPSICGAELNEFSIHRNFADLVLAPKRDGDPNGTSEAL